MIYPEAVWRPGRNAGYSAGRNAMRAAVCHYTVGRNSLSIMDKGYFNFLVSRDGTVHQGAEADAVCWHAGMPWNVLGPGIEVEYLPDYDDELWTPEQYAATARLCEWLIGLGIPDAFYDGDRISEYDGFITHRSLIQTGDWHYDWWPELPRIAPPQPEPEPKDDTMKGILLHKPGEAAIWLCFAAWKRLIQTEAELEGHKFLAPRTGLIADGPDNGAYEASAEYIDSLRTLR